MEQIVVVGSLNMDLVGGAPHLPAPGETVGGTHFFQASGGKGGNQAYAAALLGGQVTMLGRTGEDDFGRQLVAGLKAGGCDVAHLGAAEGPSGVALIFLSEAGQNSILVVPGANGKYLPADFAHDWSTVSCAGIMLLQLETPIATVTAAAQAAKRAGGRVILDPAPAMADLPADLLRNVDILTPNELEASQLTGGSALRLSPDEAQAIAGELLARGVGSVVIKMGPQGCLIMDGASPRHLGAPKVEAVDTTGAGDTFNAALAVALAEGASLDAACHFALHAASLSVTRLGAQPSMPRRAEVDAWMALVKA